MLLLSSYWVVNDLLMQAMHHEKMTKFGIHT
jgi:hypothetical protein